MDSKTLIMVAAAGASLYALQQIQHTDKLKVQQPTENDANSPDNTKYVLLRVADAYAHAAERETDLTTKAAHWTSAKQLAFALKLIVRSDALSPEEWEDVQSKYTLYTDMEAGVHNQLRGHQMAGSPRDGQVQVNNPQRQAFEQAFEQPDEPPTTTTPSADATNFFPASTFGAADAADGESGTMPDSLKALETKTSKGNERVDPYDSTAYTTNNM